MVTARTSSSALTMKPPPWRLGEKTASPKAIVSAPDRSFLEDEQYADPSIGFVPDWS